MTPSRRNLLAAIALLVLVGGVTAVMTRRDSHVAALSGPSIPPGHVVMISRAAPDAPTDALNELSSVQAAQVSTFSDLQARLRPDDLLIIDASALNEVPSDFLSAQFRAGRPVMGLNISAGELDARGGFLQQSAQIQPMWGHSDLTSRPGEPFFTLMMLRKAGGTWQRVIAQPTFRDGVFRSYLNQARLAAQDLTYIPSETGGQIVPLSDLGGTPSAR